MISVEDAAQIVLDNTKALEPRKIDIKESLGFYLAKDVVSDMDMPPFNRSAMDGYAVIAGDVASPPAKLKVIETITAGMQPECCVEAGKAAKIMTGAIVPEGADSVIMVEDTEPVCNGTNVKVLKDIKKGKNIALMGEDMRKGQVVLKARKKIRPQEVGVLASVGVKEVDVFRKPSIGIISTGDELIEIGEELKPGKIRNSNSYSLAAQAMRVVDDVEIIGIAADNKETITSMIKSGLEKDALILSGGVSMGDYDFVGEVLKELGVEVFFEKVALRPGKPTVFGKHNNTLLFALPGNPVATFVTFELFVLPAIRKMMGSEKCESPLIKAAIEIDYKAKKKRREFRPACVRQNSSGLTVAPVEWHGSADLLSTTNANCLIVVPENLEKFEKGQMVDVMLLDDPF